MTEEAYRRVLQVLRDATQCESDYTTRRLLVGIYNEILIEARAKGCDL